MRIRAVAAANGRANIMAYMIPAYFLTEAAKLIDALNLLGIQDFKGRRVPIKLHMGEPGNEYYVSPHLVRLVVQRLKEISAKPFLFDTTVLYPGPRSSVKGYERVAKEHGFGLNNIGCETVIGEEGVEVVDFGHRFQVAREIYTNTHLIVISHVKGHILAGFGGAIKNLGMGGVTRETKKLIHHMSSLGHLPDKCSLCGECEDACPREAIVVNDRWSYDQSICDGCGRCISACPNSALTSESTNLQQGLAWAASLCIRVKRVIYINALVNITRSCDCDSNPGPIVCPDIGYLASEGPAAVDRASLELINEIKPGIFEEVNRVDPSRQIQYAEEAGLTSSYKLYRL